LNKPDAYRVYLVTSGVTAFLFGMIFTASAVYQVTIVELEPLQLVLVGTTLELSVFLFEVPTGVVADVYSRRISIIIGYVLIGLGFILEGSIPLFLTILLSQVIWGIGYTFTSGATQAWITDEVGETKAGTAFMRGSQIGQVASLIGIGAGMLLGSLSVTLPILVGGIFMVVLSFSLILVMPETGFKPTPREDRNSWQVMAHTFREGLSLVRRRPTLRTIILIGLFYGLYSEGFDRLWTKHLLEDFALPSFADVDPVIFIGAIQAVGLLLAVGGTELARRSIDTDSHRSVARSLMIITGVLVVCLFLFAQARLLVVALLAFWVIYVSRNIIYPVYTAWINQRVDSQVRATVHSMSGQMDAAGQIVGGPILGFIGSAISIQAALTVSSLLLLPTLPLYARTLKHRQPAIRKEE